MAMMRPKTVVFNAVEIPVESIMGSPRPDLPMAAKIFTMPRTVPRRPKSGEIPEEIYKAVRPRWR